MVHWKTLLALCAVLVPIQGATLGWLVINERRLTRIETILEIRFPPLPRAPYVVPGVYLSSC